MAQSGKYENLDNLNQVPEPLSLISLLEKSISCRVIEQGPFPPNSNVDKATNEVVKSISCLLKLVDRGGGSTSVNLVPVMNKRSNNFYSNDNEFSSTQKNNTDNTNLTVLEKFVMNHDRCQNLKIPSISTNSFELHTKRPRLSAASSVAVRTTGGTGEVELEIEQTLKPKSPANQLKRRILPYSMTLKEFFGHLDEDHNAIVSTDATGQKRKITPNYSIVKTISIVLPITCLGSLMALEKGLEDKKVEDALLRRLSRIGGPSPKNCLERIMKALLTTELKTSLCHREKVETESSFESYKTARIVFDVTNDELKGYLKIWLDEEIAILN